MSEQAEIINYAFDLNNNDAADSGFGVNADDNTEVTDICFIVEGAMIHLNPDGSVMAIADAGTHIRDYAEAIKAQGFEVPEIILGGSTRLG